MSELMAHPFCVFCGLLWSFVVKKSAPTLPPGSPTLSPKKIPHDSTKPQQRCGPVLPIKIKQEPHWRAYELYFVD